MRKAASICPSERYLLPDGTKSNFHIGEFKCKCGACDFRDVDEKLIVGMQLVRNVLGTRLKITSGIRCEEYNRQLYESRGQTPTQSHHIPDEFGVSGAADIVALDGPSSADVYLEAHALKYTHLHGRGLGPTTVHVDTGPIRSWGYGKHAGDKPELWIAELIMEDFKG